MNRKGILLVEFLIYLMLFSIIAMLSAVWISYVWNHYIRQAKERHALITLYVAHDILARDIHAMQKIIHCTPDYVVAQADQNFIGWQKHNDQLLRLQGSYNIGTHTWSASTKSIIAQPVDKVVFIAHEDGIEFLLHADKVEINNRVNFDEKVFYGSIKK